MRKDIEKRNLQKKVSVYVKETIPELPSFNQS